MSGRIVIISGPPGAGKSTIARLLAETSPSPYAIHLHTDDFYGYIRRGYIAPWRAEARTQNAVVLRALAIAAATYVGGGYDVYVDGVIGPWFFHPWLDIARGDEIDLNYVLLLPNEQTIVQRIQSRQGHPLTDPEPGRQMHRQMAAIDSVRAHALDTTALSVEETIAAIRAGLDRGQFRLTEPRAD